MGRRHETTELSQQIGILDNLQKNFEDKRYLDIFDRCSEWDFRSTIWFYDSIHDFHWVKIFCQTCRKHCAKMLHRDVFLHPLYLHTEQERGLWLGEDGQTFVSWRILNEGLKNIGVSYISVHLLFKSFFLILTSREATYRLVFIHCRQSTIMFIPP